VDETGGGERETVLSPPLIGRTTRGLTAKRVRGLQGSEAPTMPLPRRLAKFNRIATNRVLGPLARFLPGFAVVSHVGRRSGRSYRTPVNLFRRRDDYVIALTYGADSQWVRNVLAAGAVDIETRGRHVHLVDPTVVREPDRSLVPKPVRVALSLAKVDEFMVLERAGDRRAHRAPVRG
jgi:deazaflavin-dependent oxidoreductase (nitroreductase family)